MAHQRIPSLKLLMGFEAAARHGNFSRAADELHVTQSAISHQVQQLEEEVGQPLFRRVGRGVELTVAGEVLRRSVQRSVGTLRSGLDRIATYLDPGLVVIAAPAELLHGWLSPRIDQLLVRHPALCPMLSTDESARFIDETDIDIAIADRPLQQAGLMEVPFLKDEWVVVANDGLAARLADLPAARHPEHASLICLEESFTRDDTAALFRHQLAPFRKHVIYDDERLLLDAALRGRGIACVSRLVADESLTQGRLRVLADYPRIEGTTWWVSRVAGEPRSPVVTDVFEWLIASAQ
ncbi:LysR family transcriptional regulator [Pandoraea fibrosis]|uniref:LysR family transcriptional regulator n=1 Tax=Pandoraea fibrosis TaxID=1891094 RepID=A0ABX6HS10_9BURK|nr:LysR family transcriptional regulator [Pandoraea fibrosis]QHE93141.1 LysR family transcriptional regulator [Pandoraea fibrosis]QHF13300.1 LysR family transcriptional regulator [Pandoraea fibrosis]